MFSKILTLALLTLPTISSAAILPNASRVKFPKVGEASCFAREYSNQHLAINPGQVVSKMYVKVANRVSAEAPYESAIVVASGRDGQLYYNDAAGCDPQSDGSLYCFVECDGGSFNLVPLRGRINLKITKDYYFPIFKSGASVEDPAPGDQLSLMGSDKDNNLFKLYPVDMGQCDRAYQAAKSEIPGC